jgi:hypothetical protein
MTMFYYALVSHDDDDDDKLTLEKAGEKSWVKILDRLND